MINVSNGEITSVQRSSDLTYWYVGKECSLGTIKYIREAEGEIYVDLLICEHCKSYILEEITSKK